jgi:hypothetical protein
MVQQVEVCKNHTTRHTTIASWPRVPLSLPPARSCVGGLGLSVVCRLLSEDAGGWRGGMPDLLLWRPSSGEALIVEVKVNAPRVRSSTRVRRVVCVLPFVAAAGGRQCRGDAESRGLQAGRAVKRVEGCTRTSLQGGSRLRPPAPGPLLPDAPVTHTCFARSFWFPAPGPPRPPVRPAARLDGGTLGRRPQS